MKYLIINPAIRMDAIPYNFPVGLGYIASVLRNAGHEVKVFDNDIMRLAGPGLSHELERLLQGADIVAMGGLITTYRTQVEIIEMIRRQGFRKPIVLGGGLATSEYEILLEDLDITACVLHEGEKTIEELAECFDSGRDFRDIPGIAFKNDSGKIIRTADRESILDLDTIDFPAWDLFPIREYLKNYFHADLVHGDIRGLNEMVMFTSRGCPYKCNFCYHIHGYNYRTRSVGNIIQEIKLLKSKYGPKLLVRFIDDCFVINKKRLVEFCNRIIDDKIDLNWCCMGRANICTREILKLMRKAGCVYVGYGLESGDEHILREVINKQASVEDNIRAVRDTLDVGLSSSPTIMTNQPGENEESIKKTLKMVQSIGTSATSFFYATPYPGTPLWDYAQEKGLIKMPRREFLLEIADKNVDHLLVNFTELPDEELIRLHDYVEGEIRKMGKKVTFRRVVSFFRRNGLIYGAKKIFCKAMSTFCVNQ